MPGTLQGVNEATVYARSNGYVLRWLKDIGSDVAKGELLAIISAPEIDEELSQAIAAQQQAASGESLAKSTAERWKALRESDSVSQQDLDERLSAYQQAQANLASAKANTARLRNLQNFNQVVAPFTGVVTSRSIHVGDLVDAGMAARVRHCSPSRRPILCVYMFMFRRFMRGRSRLAMR